MIKPEKCELTKFPAPVLAEKAKPIDQITDDIRDLADKMIDIMIETHGVGLAGPQAGVNLRIFVISTDCTRENAKVYINPTIEPSGNILSEEEGCLSLPGIFAKVKRYESCSVTATDLDGNEFSEKAEGLLAKALQHEHDHLEGTLIKDKMSRIALIAARSKLKQLREEA